jgi:hypothetical protein
MIRMAGTYLVNGARVEMPDSTAAMLGWQRAPDITQTPFAPSGTLNSNNTAGRRGEVDHSASLAPDAACVSLAARAQQYPGVDPIPQIRAALIEKCENYQRTRQVAVSGGPTEEAAPSSVDPKIIAAGVAAVLLVGVIVLKRKKR